MLCALGAAALAAMSEAAKAVVEYSVPGSTYSENFDTLANLSNNGTPGTPTTDPGAGISTWTNGSATSTNTGTAGFYVFNSTIAGATLSFQDGNAVTGSGQGPRNFIGPDGVAPTSWTAATAYFANANSGSKLFSFGATMTNPVTNSVNPATDRSLGTLSGSATPRPGDTYTAVVLKNTSGQTFNQFTVSYDSEKWRDVLNNSTTAGSNAVPAPTASNQGLLFSYLVTATLTGAGGPDDASVSDIVTVPDTTAPYDANADGNNGFGAYTRVPALDKTYSTLAGPAALAYSDGNDPANRASLSSVINSTWAPNQYLILRWFDNDETGGDIGIGIDNLTVSTVPEPAAAALVAMAAPFLMARRRRRA